LGTKDNVTLVNKGLGDRCNEFELYKHAEVSGLASLTKRRLDHFNIAMDKVERVTVQTLDEAVQQHDVAAIDLLKIDVEGHELDVLKGAAQAFRDERIELLQFEFGGCNLDTRTSVQDFFYFFREHRFTIGLIQPTGRIHWLPKYDEFLEHYRTTNFIAAPSSC
jgi:FkbM family methyltransferase